MKFFKSIIIVFSMAVAILACKTDEVQPVSDDVAATETETESVTEVADADVVTAPEEGPSSADESDFQGVVHPSFTKDVLCECRCDNVTNLNDTSATAPEVVPLIGPVVAPSFTESAPVNVLK